MVAVTEIEDSKLATSRFGFRVILGIVVIASSLVVPSGQLAATSGSCAVRDEVRMGKVCLPSNSRGSLKWQTIPSTGKKCSVSGTLFQQFGCTRMGRSLVWSIYGNPANWVCRPQATDICDDSTAVTHVAPDLSLTKVDFAPAISPPVDCFYVYPTSSEDQTLNSDLSVGNERAVVFKQAARFSNLCRVYVPLYRSVTIASMFGQAIAGDREQAWNLAFGDVKEAWNHYLTNENKGRGVILLGHSQGSTHLVRLIDEVIDPSRSQRKLLVSAVLLGRAVTVPRGQVVGGVFSSVPLCRAPGQTGCVISYAAFPADSPPPISASLGLPLFVPGKATVPMEAACTNPAALQGGPGQLTSAFATAAWAFTSDSRPAIETPFMGFPGLVSAECSSTGTHSYLKVTFAGDSNDSRVDRIDGDLGPENGLHSFDWELAAITILDVVRQQIASFTSRR